MKHKAKKGPGRPAAPEGRVKLTTTLSPVVVERARAIGGSVSRGIEMAVTEYWNGIQPANAQHIQQAPKSDAIEAFANDLEIATGCHRKQPLIAQKPKRIFRDPILRPTKPKKP